MFLKIPGHGVQHPLFVGAPHRRDQVPLGSVAGETVDLFRHCSRGDDGTVSYIIEGKVDGKTVFTARIDY